MPRWPSANSRGTSSRVRSSARGCAELTAGGDQVLKAGLDPAREMVTAVVVQVIEHVLAELDLTALVREQVDTDAIAAGMVDRVLGRHRSRDDRG